MNREVIADAEGICLVILFIAGSTLALPTGSAAGSDLWLAVLLALIIAIPLYLIYSRLLSLYHGNDIFDILEKVFGKFFGKALSLIFVLYTFSLASLILRDQGEYLITLSLPETPMVVPIFMMTALSIFVVKAGIETLARWAKLFVIFNGPVPTITILMLIPQMDMNNILPILFNGVKPLLEGTLQALTFPFGDSVVFIMIFFALKSKKSSYNVLIKGLLWGGILIVGVSMAEVLVLGQDVYLSTYYPNHSVAGKVDIGEILHRLEVIAIVATITSFFLKISVCLLAVCNGISKIFELKDYRSIVVPIALLMCNSSYFIFGSVMEKFTWNKEVGVYYFLPFQVFLPVIVLIFAEIKKRHGRRKKTG
ncbi:endospore germination permease [Wukongibacter baidiensis]|uniref:GerAB/ArcD/ProY family transporter n=1 Tax=Wukongibacter baidiensis TaxID=1723361 RepID=UPI003D7FC6E6